MQPRTVLPNERITGGSSIRTALPTHAARDWRRGPGIKAGVWGCQERITESLSSRNEPSTARDSATRVITPQSRARVITGRVRRQTGGAGRGAWKYGCHSHLSEEKDVPFANRATRHASLAGP